jgi:hypothetical protein
VTKGVNSTSTFANASTGNRALLDPRTVQLMAGTTTAVVVSVVAASVAASLAGASSGPGALAVIGEVQIMSQLGKVGGGKGALKQFRSLLSDFCVVDSRVLVPACALLYSVCVRSRVSLCPHTIAQTATASRGPTQSCLSLYILEATSRSVLLPPGPQIVRQA